MAGNEATSGSGGFTVQGPTTSRLRDDNRVEDNEAKFGGGILGMPELPRLGAARCGSGHPTTWPAVVQASEIRRGGHHVILA